MFILNYNTFAAIERDTEVMDRFGGMLGLRSRGRFNSVIIDVTTYINCNYTCNCRRTVFSNVSTMEKYVSALYQLTNLNVSI